MMIVFIEERNNCKVALKANEGEGSMNGVHAMGTFPRIDLSMGSIVSSVDTVLADIGTFLLENNPGTSVTIRIAEMTEKEFETLNALTGF